MPRADLAQPGILDPIPAQARSLSCQVRVGAQPLPVLQALARQTDGRHTVVGLSASLVQAFGPRVQGLKTFTGIEGPRTKLPATPTDLLIWLRGDARVNCCGTAARWKPCWPRPCLPRPALRRSPTGARGAFALLNAYPTS